MMLEIEYIDKLSFLKGGVVKFMLRLIAYKYIYTFASQNIKYYVYKDFECAHSVVHSHDKSRKSSSN